MKRLLQYGAVLTVATFTAFCFKVFFLNPILFGSPYKTYPASTITVKPDDLNPMFLDMLKSVTLIDIVQSLLVGIIICFVFWMIEMIVKKVKNK